MPEKKSDAPVHVGTLAMTYQKLRAKRLKADKVAEELKRQESELGAQVLAALNAEKLDQVRTKLGSVGRKQEEIPLVEDWGAVYEFIRKTRSFDLLQKRIGVEAWRSRLEEHVEVPGIRIEARWKLTHGTPRS